MDCITLSLPLFVLPGSDQIAPINVELSPLGIVVDDLIGTGKELKEGERVTFHYEVLSANGKLLASSETRGLDYTTSIPPQEGDAPIVEALVGVRAGGERRILTRWSLLGFGPAIAAVDDVTVRVKVLSVRRIVTQR